jgi:biopolymer transport protein TolR
MPAVQAQGGRKKRRMNAEINVVPYIDVMLVLLVIFMVTAPLLTQGIDVELPKVDSSAMANQDEPVTLYVNASGQYFLDAGTEQSKPLSDDELVKRVNIIIGSKPQTMVLVRADRAVSYERVVRGMSLLQAGGASKIGFVTDPGTDNSRKRNPG